MAKLNIRASWLNNLKDQFRRQLREIGYNLVQYDVVSNKDNSASVMITIISNRDIFSMTLMIEAKDSHEVTVKALNTIIEEIKNLDNEDHISDPMVTFKIYTSEDISGVSGEEIMEIIKLSRNHSDPHNFIIKTIEQRANHRKN